MHEQLGKRLAHDVAAADNHGSAAGGGYSVAAEQCDDAGGSGREEARKAYRHASDVDGVESVDVFAVVDGFDSFLLVDVARQGELYDESVGPGVVVEAPDGFEQFGFGDVGIEADERGAETATLAFCGLRMARCRRRCRRELLRGAERALPRL